jgi:hypothetical protein
MPAWPCEPWPCPAINDAIQVPCRPQPELETGVPTPVRSGPEVTEPARSDTAGLTPLSITATSTPRPWLTCQALGTFNASSTHCCAPRTWSASAGPATASGSPMALITATALATQRSS